MSKELEALKILKANAILFDDGTDFGASMLEAITVLDKALTPPTAEEVCEVLNNYYGEKVYYYETNKTLYLSSSKYCNGKSGVISLDKLKDNPELIELIAKFYKGESK